MYNKKISDNASRIVEKIESTIQDRNILIEERSRGLAELLESINDEGTAVITDGKTVTKTSDKLDLLIEDLQAIKQLAIENEIISGVLYSEDESEDED